VAATNHRRSGADPAAIQAEIERFLSTCQDPVLLEPGEAAAPLRPGEFALHARPPGCVVEVWGERGGLVRRIVAAGSASAGRLPLKARAFGGTEINLEIIDRAAGGRRIERLEGVGRFAKTLARLLAREFPHHRVEGLTAAADLHRSLSSSYVRGTLLRGADSWAVIAASPEATAETCDQILTFGLLWLEEARRRKRSRALAGLRIFLPQGRTDLTLQRLPWLNQALARYEAWDLGSDGEMRRREPGDAPPLDLDLPLCHPAIHPQGWVREKTDLLASRTGVHWRMRPDGLVSFEVGGLSFARASAQTLTYGLENDVAATPATFARVIALAEHLLRFRAADGEDRTHPLFLTRAETWLAEQVRANPTALSPTLMPAPLHTSVPAVLGRDRGILDLLGIERDGRLAVIELKADEDIHLPLQALDYWMRARELALQGAFEEKRYFPGFRILGAAPRLILAAPALKFHAQTDVLVRFLSPQISLERIGVCSDWRRGLRVEFRSLREPADAGAPPQGST
jgi:hypothetical protein